MRNDRYYSNSYRRKGLGNSGSGKAMRNLLIAVFVVAVAAFSGFFLIRCNATQNDKAENPYGDNPNNWVLFHQDELNYVFDEDDPFKVVEKANVDEIFQGSYENAYDFNRDAVPEKVAVSLTNQGEIIQAQIQVEGHEAITVELDGMKDNLKSFVVTGIELDDGNRALAAVESVFVPDDGKGYLRCHVFTMKEGVFVKTSDITYSGVIGDRGMMVQGVIENRVPEDNYYYDVEANQNEYVYDRSRVFADMKDVGIKFPFETLGKFMVEYKRNVTGICYVIVY